MAKKKLTRCKACDAEIAVSAKTCPHCGAKNKKPLFKKAWFWVLVIILLIGFMGGDEEEPTPSATAEIKTETVASQAEASPVATPNTEAAPATEPAKIAFSPLTAVDNEYCKILITGIEPGNLWGYTIDIELENKSPDKTYMFSIDTCSVNGVQCATLFASEIAPGKKAIKDITLADNQLKNNGITEFTDIELGFRVYDSNDWAAGNVAEETVNLYPFGADKATTFVRESKSSDILLFDNDSVCAVVTGFSEDSIWGYTANLYLMNKTDTSVMFSVDEASLNGYMCDPFFASEVAPGKCYFTSMSWSDTALAEIGITDYSAITDIAFNFRAYDSRNWSGSSFADETIVLNP